MVERIDALFEVMSHHSLGVCGVTAMTENEVSNSILSWCHKINFKLADVVEPNCFSTVKV